MDRWAHLSSLVLVICTLLTNAFLSFAPSSACPRGLVAFGDSLTDTGDLLHLVPSLAFSRNPPYGRTYFHRPTGRFSDGRLLVDFIAMAFGYPLLQPYFDVTGRPGVDGVNFRRGVNFAVAGATANPTVVSPFTLPLQVDEFLMFKNQTKKNTAAQPRSELLSARRNKSPAASFFRKALYIVGEIGENDLRNAILNLKMSIPQVEATIVPHAIATIVRTAKRLYGAGARNFLFVGILAQGCSAYTLTVFGSNQADELDSLGCLKSFNNLVQVFNFQLQSAVQELKKDLRDASIVFADYYNASLAIFSDPSKYHFDPKVVHIACCGIGGNYNFDIQRECGSDNTVKVCSDPSKYIVWDGIHFTDAFYGTIARFFLSGKFLDPPINLSAICSLKHI